MTEIVPEQDNTDFLLIKRVTDGDKSACHLLYTRHAPVVLAFLSARAPRSFDLDGLAQEVWTKVFQKLSTFKHDNFRAWVLHVARNTLYDQMRSTKRRPSAQMPENYDPIAVSQEIIEDDPRLSAMKNCLTELDHDYIHTIRQVKLDGISPERLAEQINININTIYSRINKGLKMVRECIEKKLL
jgi:RNA polymerase sigma-70 factor (ECF subfamily)